MNMFSRLWMDEAGFVVSSELVLVATLLVLGMIVGLSEVRNSVVQELTDLGQTFGTINQTYSFNGVTGHVSSTAGSFRLDLLDFCDVAADTTLSEPGCVAIGGVNIAPTPEG
jgi:Flp pilus assembly pilin Flp